MRVKAGDSKLWLLPEQLTKFVMGKLDQFQKVAAGNLFNSIDQ